MVDVGATTSSEGDQGDQTGSRPRLPTHNSCDTLPGYNRDLEEDAPLLGNSHGEPSERDKR